MNSNDSCFGLVFLGQKDEAVSVKYNPGLNIMQAVTGYLRLSDTFYLADLYLSALNTQFPSMPLTWPQVRPVAEMCGWWL